MSATLTTNQMPHEIRVLQLRNQIQSLELSKAFICGGCKQMVMMQQCSMCKLNMKLKIEEIGELKDKLLKLEV